MREYKVAVICLCYNHAPYVDKTLNGLAIQKTNFKYVSLIIDDASKDGTKETIINCLNRDFIAAKDCLETDEAIFSFYHHKDNNNYDLVFISLKYNFFQHKKPKYPLVSNWLENCDFWAFCECDDYWLDDNKLQEEVDFLQKHEEYGLVYTDFDIENYDTGDYVHAAFQNGIKPVISSFDEHLVKAAYIAPMSWVCRIPFSDLIGEYAGPPSIDVSFIIALEAFRRSKVYFMNKVTCVYGKHSDSATKHKSLSKQYEYSYGVYATQKYYLDKYNLREKYPTCLDYFLNAYYCYIISNKIEKEYNEVKPFFNRHRKSSFKFRVFEIMMNSRFTFPIFQAICRYRIKKN